MRRHAVSKFQLIFVVKENRLLATLRGHEGLVNVAGWFECHEAELEYSIFSAGTDNQIIVWEMRGPRTELVFERVATLEGHKSSVMDVSTFGPPDEQGVSILVSTAADGNVIVWSYRASDHSWQKLQVFDTKLVDSVAATLFGKFKTPMFACGTVDGDVHLYALVADQVRTMEFWKFSEIEFEEKLVLHGHEDSVRSIAFRGNALVSSAQDRRVRLWSIMPHVPGRQYEGFFELNETREENCLYGVILESVLLGHDDWVMGVAWCVDSMSFVTCSMDRTVVLWEPAATGVWFESARMGSVGSANVNEHQVGYSSVAISPDANSVLCVGYAGGLHRWCASSGEWQSAPVVTGHAGYVRDIVWGEDDAAYFASFSSDRTCRLWALRAGDFQCHEISRPLVHGYELSSGVLLSSSGGLVVASEEKILRVYQMPSLVRRAVETFTSSSVRALSSIHSAHNQPLSLSNKPVFDGDDGGQFLLNLPPTEDALSQFSLWPETNMLHGHGNALASICVSTDEKLIASACHSNMQTHEKSHFVIWDGETFDMLQTAAGPRLTILSSQFSHDSLRLAAASRDHGVYIFSRADTNSPFALTHKNVETHKRPILTISWSPDDSFIASGGRDKKLVIWRTPSVHEPLLPLKSHILSHAITSSCWIPLPCVTTLAVGFSDGSISLLLSLFEESYHVLTHTHSHNSPVTRILHKILYGTNTMLSASFDHSIQLHSIRCGQGGILDAENKNSLHT